MYGKVTVQFSCKGPTHLLPTLGEAGSETKPWLSPSALVLAEDDSKAVCSASNLEDIS